MYVWQKLLIAKFVFLDNVYAVLWCFMKENFLFACVFLSALYMSNHLLWGSFFIGSTSMTLLPISHKTIIYFLSLLDVIGNFTVCLLCIVSLHSEILTWLPSAFLCLIFALLLHSCSLYVSLLCFLWFWEVFVQMFDCQEWPCCTISHPYGLKSCCFGWKPCCCM